MIVFSFILWKWVECFSMCLLNPFWPEVTVLRWLTYHRGVEFWPRWRSDLRPWFHWHTLPSSCTFLDLFCSSHSGMDKLGKYRCYQWRRMSGLPKKRLFSDFNMIRMWNILGSWLLSSFRKNAFCYMVTASAIIHIFLSKYILKLKMLIVQHKILKHTTLKVRAACQKFVFNIFDFGSAGRVGVFV